MHAPRRLILSASVRFSNDRNLINQTVKILSYLACIGVISIIYFTLCKIKKKFVSKTYIKVLVTFDAEVMVAPLAAADVNPSIESWKLHLSLLQKHSSTLGDHPNITSAKGLNGWGQKKWQFLLAFSTIYADIGREGGSEKVQNMMT
mgnify:CR=1 FL=1